MLSRSPRSLLCLAAASSVLAASTDAQQVRTVGPGPGLDFQEIQDAVDASADGDVILVDPDTYAPVHIDGKGLRIHATSGGVTVLNQPVGGSQQPAIRISGLSASQSVVLDQVQVFTDLPFASSAVRIEGCAGPVWYQRGFINADGGNALHVIGSDSVVVTDSLLQANLAAPGPSGDPEPAAGALVEGASRLFAYDADFSGSDAPFIFGGPPELMSPLVGGDGITVVDSTVVLHGGVVSGGSGSTYFDDGCPTGSDGGAGARLLTTGLQVPALRFTDPVISGGAPGFSQPCAAPGSTGAPIEPGSGDVVDTLQSLRLMVFEQGLRAPGENLHVEVEGQAGDLVFVFASVGAIPALSLPTGFLFGDVDLHLTPAPWFTLADEAIGPGSTLTLALTVPALPPGVELVTPALQGLILDGVTFFPHTGAPNGLSIR